eukprot:16164-Heterococcus_DN1.PRE.3
MRVLVPLSLLSAVAAFVAPPAIVPCSSAQAVQTCAARVSVPALAATSADGQNLRPDIAQQLEAIADEAKGRIDSMVKENKGIKAYSDWQTIPQLYVDGEFMGGSDIMIELYQSGELETTMKDKGVKFNA